MLARVRCRHAVHCAVPWGLQRPRDKACVGACVVPLAGSLGSSCVNLLPSACACWQSPSVACQCQPAVLHLNRHAAPTVRATAALPPCTATLYRHHTCPPAEYCLSGAAGQLGQAQADVLLGCMEVCMEDLVAELTGGAGE